MPEVITPRSGSKMEQLVGEGLVKEFKRLSADEVRARRGAVTVTDRSPEGKLPVEALPPPDPRRVDPLTAKATYEAMLGRMWANVRSSRQNYQQVIAHIRATNPSAVSYMTDQQLFDHLEGLARKYTQRLEQRKRLNRPVILPSGR